MTGLFHPSVSADAQAFVLGGDSERETDREKKRMGRRQPDRQIDRYDERDREISHPNQTD